MNLSSSLFVAAVWASLFSVHCSASPEEDDAQTEDSESALATTPVAVPAAKKCVCGATSKVTCVKSLPASIGAYANANACTLVMTQDYCDQSGLKSDQRIDPADPKMTEPESAERAVAYCTAVHELRHLCDGPKAGKCETEVNGYGDDIACLGKYQAKLCAGKEKRPAGCDALRNAGLISIAAKSVVTCLNEVSRSKLHAGKDWETICINQCNDKMGDLLQTAAKPNKVSPADTRLVKSTCDSAYKLYNPCAKNNAKPEEPKPVRETPSPSKPRETNDAPVGTASTAFAKSTSTPVLLRGAVKAN